MRTLLVLIGFVSAPLLGQHTPGVRFNTLEVTAGRTLESKSAGIGRLTVAYSFTSNSRLGLYYTLENKTLGSALGSKSEASSNYSKDLLGASYLVHNNFALYGGVGVTHGGLLNSMSIKGLRKEMGISYKNWDHNFSFSAGYSFSVGLTANFGLLFPLSKSITYDPAIWY
jgi:hypothetical protein